MLKALGFPGGLDSKESVCKAENPDSIPGLGRSPGEFHGQRSLEGCGPWGRKEQHRNNTEMFDFKGILRNIQDVWRIEEKVNIC